MTKDVRQIIYETPRPPLRFKWVIWPDVDQNMARQVMLTVSRENFNDLNPTQMQASSEWIGAVMTKIRKLNIPCYLELVGQDRDLYNVF